MADRVVGFGLVGGGLMGREFASAAAATDEHGPWGGGLEHARLVGDVVGEVGLDHVGAELNRLADERHDLLRIAV